MNTFGEKVTTATVFGLIALAATGLALFVWIMPAARSLRRAGADARLIQSRYLAEAGLAAELEYNLRELDEIRGTGFLLTHGFVPALEEITGLAEYHRLLRREMSVAEPAAHNVLSEGGRIYEMRVSAAYEGGFEDVTAFVYDLSRLGAVLSMTIDAAGTAAGLYLEYSLFSSTP